MSFFICIFVASYACSDLLSFFLSLVYYANLLFQKNIIYFTNIWPCFFFFNGTLFLFFLIICIGDFSQKKKKRKLIKYKINILNNKVRRWCWSRMLLWNTAFHQTFLVTLFLMIAIILQNSSRNRQILDLALFCFQQHSSTKSF